MARQMVVNYGMSDALGQQTFGQPNHESVRLRPLANTRIFRLKLPSESTREVARLMKQAHDTAYEILSQRADQMHTMAEVLLDRETVDGAACEALLNNTWAEFSKKEAAGEIPPRRGVSRSWSLIGKQGGAAAPSPQQAAEPQGNSSQQQ